VFIFKIFVKTKISEFTSVSDNKTNKQALWLVANSTAKRLNLFAKSGIIIATNLAKGISRQISGV